MKAFDENCPHWQGILSILNLNDGVSKMNTSKELTVTEVVGGVEVLDQMNEIAKIEVAAAPVRMKVVKSRPAAKVKLSNVSYPDGTVWFRADRQKWIAMWGGKQEAARPTSTKALEFLMKKYSVSGTVITA